MWGGLETTADAGFNASPKPGGLAMRGGVQNWASFETPNGKPIFKMKSQPDSDLTPEQWATAASAAGVVVSMDADSRGTFRQDA